MSIVFAQIFIALLSVVVTWLSSHCTRKNNNENSKRMQKKGKIKKHIKNFYIINY